MGTTPKVLLDTDAAILFGDSEFAERGFFAELPVAMTAACLAELKRLRSDSALGSSASDAYFQYEYRENIEQVRTRTGLSSEQAELLRRADETVGLDAGERSILQKLLADNPCDWFVASNDSDLLRAVDTIQSEFQFATRQIGTPAVAVRPFVVVTDVTKQDCLEMFETEAGREGWDWEQIESRYRSDLGM